MSGKIPPAIKATLLSIAGVSVIAIHWYLLTAGPFRAWKVFNLLLGFFLLWMAILIGAEKDQD